MRMSFISGLRSFLAVVLGYIVIAVGTVLTFNGIVGQVSVASPPWQLLAGTIGAALSGLAGGMTAGLIAPRAPVLHAFGVWIILALDTAFVIAKGSGPVWFDLAGSSVLAICAVLGGAFIAWRKSLAADAPASV